MKKGNFLTRFFGLHDKEQKERTKEVTVYADQKREEFSKEMGKIKRQTQKVHQKQLQAHEETAKLVEMVDDITHRIMVATGGNHRNGK